jgi:antitoxin VapB
MALSIKSPEVERKVRKLAAVTGMSMTEAVSLAVDERLAKEERKRANQDAMLADIRAIIDHCSSLPVLDNRSEEEIMGWDENGLPS